MKRLADPMVTIEVRDIAKLAGYIKIPSMAEGASTTDTDSPENPLLRPPELVPEMLKVRTPSPKVQH